MESNCLATKVLFEGTNAYGVEYECQGNLPKCFGLFCCFNQKKDGNLYSRNATKEIIISAGTVKSPQLLMLSGIGDCSGNFAFHAQYSYSFFFLKAN